MRELLAGLLVEAVALLAEGVDRNIPEFYYKVVDDAASPSSRRAWIEIGSACTKISGC